MTAVRRHLRALVWLALFTMGGLVVAPTVSRALAWGGAPSFAEAPHQAMHADGSGQMHSHAGMHDGGSGPEHRHTLDHCELCAIAAAAYAVIPALDLQLPLPLDPFGDTPVAVRSLHGRDAWQAPAARGPPRTS